MSENGHPFPKEVFDTVYSLVPRLTVEVLLLNPELGVFLAERAIQPCLGQWHLPGGTVGMKEAPPDTLQRIAQREVGIDITKAVNVGYIDYKSHLREGLNDHPVGLVFRVLEYTGEIQPSHESAKTGWFLEVPENTHADLDIWLAERLLDLMGSLKSE
jgi:ADP-ribose pyrophosphatase YjhB (NUDIX family)